METAAPGASGAAMAPMAFELQSGASASDAHYPPLAAFRNAIPAQLLRDRVSGAGSATSLGSGIAVASHEELQLWIHPSGISRSHLDMEALGEACGIDRACLDGLALECEMASMSYRSRCGGRMQTAMMLHAADAVVGDRLLLKCKPIAPGLRGQAHSNCLDLLVPYITLQQRSGRHFEGWPGDCLMQYGLSIELGWSSTQHGKSATTNTASKFVDLRNSEQLALQNKPMHGRPSSWGIKGSTNIAAPGHCSAAGTRTLGAPQEIMPRPNTSDHCHQVRVWQTSEGSSASG